MVNRPQGQRRSLMGNARMAKNTLRKWGSSAQKLALEKARKASATARKTGTNARLAVGKAQISANRVVNRVTGSKTSALKKRQTAKQTVRSAATRASAAVKAAPRTARLAAGKAQISANRAVNRVKRRVAVLRSNIKKRVNRPNTAKTLMARGAKPDTARRTAAAFNRAGTAIPRRRRRDTNSRKRN